MIELSVALGRVICVADPAEAAARDARMIGEAREQKSPIEAPLPPLGPGCFAEGAPAAGQLFVQDLVRQRGVTGRFDDVVGRGFALVSPARRSGRGARPRASAPGSPRSAASLRTSAPSAPVEDLNGGYARWFAKHGAAVALVRPDFAVFGAAAKLEDAGALVGALRERLAGSRPIEQR